MKPVMTIALLVSMCATVSASAALAPSPFSLQVYQPDSSNLLFVVSNASNASIRVPTSSYAISSEYEYEPVSTNDSGHIKAVYIGLWLTDDWRYMGTNWFMHMSKQDRLARLAPTNVKPGESISIPRQLSPPEAEILSSGKATMYFNFQISPESARDYGLSSGYAQATNVSGRSRSQPGGDPIRMP